MPLRAVTVYCSSSSSILPEYFQAGAELGRLIAVEGWELVYGGNAVGLMAVVADAARAAGGRVIGITPRLLVEQGIADEQCHELLVTDGMRQRKAMMEARGDAFITLPGGLGTLEEVFEILVGRYLGVHDKPVVLLNTLNYFAPLLAMIDHGIEHHFMKPRCRQLFHVADTPREAVRCLRGQD